MSIFRTDSTPLTYLITDGTATDANFHWRSRVILELVQAAIDAGISLIQLREKQLSARLLFELTAAAASVTKDSRTKVLINDRADIAAAAGADGVHLMSISLPASVIRKSFPGLLIGVSTHSLAETRDGVRQRADFALYGPVFATPGKGNLVGLEELRRVCDAVKPFPVIGIGGIDASNFESVIDSGAQGFAAIRFLNDPQNLRELTPRLKSE